MQSSDTRLALSEDEIRARIAAVPFWFHQIEVAPGVVTPGYDRSKEKLLQLQLPGDLTGKRVLDIGAFDGFFSFECERRGAEVVAIDGNPATGFGVARELLGSHAMFINMDVYDLTPESLGQFDLVLCLGVLYHLRHPMLGLERIHAVCRGQLILETQVCDHHFIDADGTPHELASFAPQLANIPIAQFYPGAELNRDSTSWWSPNVAALQSMLHSVGFEPYHTIIYDGERACIHCLRVEAPVLLEWANTASVGNPLVQSAAPSDEAQSSQAGDQPGMVERLPASREGSPISDAAAEALRRQGQQVSELQRALAQREARIVDLEARARWLDEQSRAARRALAAVENGRMLRILRWLSTKLPVR